MRYLDRLQPLALLVIRLTLGTIMSVHGYHKVFGGPEHFGHMVRGMGFPVGHLYQPLRSYLECSFA